MTPARPKPDYIIDGLWPLVVPIGDVKPLPGNPRKGDVDAVANSLQRFKQRKPVVVNRHTGEVEAGNHTCAAALQLGWEWIAAVYVEDDPTEAKGFALADNRTADLGVYDNEALAVMLQDVLNADADLAAAASYGQADLDALLAKAAEPSNHGRGLGEPVISYQIVFDTGEQQDRWHEFARSLRGRYPDCETFAERLDLYLQEA